MNSLWKVLLVNSAILRIVFGAPGPIVDASEPVNSSPVVTLGTACELIHKQDLIKCNGMLGCFITACKDDGSFFSKQCHGSVCWCVNDQGKKVSGAENAIGFDSTNPCQRKVSRGNPASIHCIARGGESVLRDTSDGVVGYCVFSDGIECEEWSLYRGNCKAETKTACELRHEEDSIECDGKNGCYVTACESDGSFTPFQCHGSVCWCVDTEGKKINGTRTSIAADLTQACRRETKTECELSRKKKLDACGQAVGTTIGCFITTCESDGSFSPLQCLGSVCWCVDSRGNKISNTVASIGADPAQACHKETKTTCQLVRKDNLEVCDQAFGCFITVCESDGSFSPQQCHGTVCWCVDDQGKKISMTETLMGAESHHACQSETKTTCELAHEKDVDMCGGVMGCYITVCKTDGSFNHRQCLGSVCWCVDDQGKKLSGTKTSIADDSNQACSSEPKTACEQQHQKYVSKCADKAGCFIVTCEADGSFSPRQCHGSMCWCVDDQGEKMVDTVSRVENYDIMQCREVHASSDAASKDIISGEAIPDKDFVSMPAKLGIVLASSVLVTIVICFYIKTSTKSNNILQMREYSEFADLAPEAHLRKPRRTMKWM